jgi:excisionase family DNA binding protein
VTRPFHISESGMEVVTVDTLAEVLRQHLGRLDEVLTVDEAAAFLRISRSVLYELIGRGEVPYRKVGGKYRFSRERLVQWLAGEK